MHCLENDIEIRIIFDRRFDWESYYSNVAKNKCYACFMYLLLIFLAL